MNGFHERTHPRFVPIATGRTIRVIAKPKGELSRKGGK